VEVIQHAKGASEDDRNVNRMVQRHTEMVEQSEGIKNLREMSTSI
jgi:hypothetical protein